MKHVIISDTTSIGQRPESNREFRHGFAFLFALAILLLGVTSTVFAQVPNLLFSFDPTASGIFGPFPPSVMAQGRDGNLYGAVNSGGANLVGGIFKVDESGNMATLYDFVRADGQHCNMGLTLGNDGSFYGACYDGGTSNFGQLFRITSAGAYTVLYSFTNAGGDGANPNAPPIQAADGNFYGTTFAGGAHHDGTIYKMTPAGKVTIIHSFLYPNEGGSPGSALAQGNNGSLYGTTEEGGGVFKVTTKGKLTVLHALSTSDGEVPLGALIQGADGKFYGTTTLGGAHGGGTVFRVTAAGKFTVLENFDPTVDGQGDPWVELVEASDTNLYGVSFRSGISGESQYGGLFKLTKKGVFSSLYLFDGKIGANPASALVQHTSGLLYGNAQNNAGFNVGSIYTLDVGAAPFCSANLTSGKVGSVVGILGQGFTGSSVVKFGGVAATSVTVDGSGYLTAAVPAGAITGSITVTVGSTTLTSLQSFKVK
jgi:uncharacterized repeat protein (TIGR03803 family)